MLTHVSPNLGLPRIGTGIDVHRLVAGAPLHLAGLAWPDEPEGLEGHSDADVAAHAACDALLSAAGLGDLGSNFGTAEPQWSGASGATLLEETARRVRASGFEIGNGAIQVTGDGSLVVLGPDAAVTGGYPVVGLVEEASRDALARAPAGSELRFARAP